MAIISVKASWRLWGFWEILSQHAPKAAWEMPEVPEVPFFLLFWAQVAALPRTELSEELLVLPEAKVNALEWLNANLTRLTQAEMLPVAKPGQPVSNKFKQSQKIKKASHLTSSQTLCKVWSGLRHWDSKVRLNGWRTEQLRVSTLMQELKIWPRNVVARKSRYMGKSAITCNLHFPQAATAVCTISLEPIQSRSNFTRKFHFSETESKSTSLPPVTHL